MTWTSSPEAPDRHARIRDVRAGKFSVFRALQRPKAQPKGGPAILRGRPFGCPRPLFRCAAGISGGVSAHGLERRAAGRPGRPAPRARVGNRAAAGYSGHVWPAAARPGRRAAPAAPQDAASRRRRTSVARPGRTPLSGRPTRSPRTARAGRPARSPRTARRGWLARPPGSARSPRTARPGRPARPPRLARSPRTARRGWLARPPGSARSPRTARPDRPARSPRLARSPRTARPGRPARPAAAPAAGAASARPVGAAARDNLRAARVPQDTGA